MPKKKNKNKKKGHVKNKSPQHHKKQPQREKKAALVILLKLIQVAHELKKTIAFSKLMRDKSHDITLSKIIRNESIRELPTLCEFNSNALTDVSLVEIVKGDIFEVRIPCIKKTMFRHDKNKLQQAIRIKYAFYPFFNR